MLWQGWHENAYRQVMSCCFHVMSCCVMSCQVMLLKDLRALLCCKKVFHVCPQEFRGSNMSANSKAPYTADAHSTNQTTLQSQTEWHCCHRQTVLGLNDNSVTYCSRIDQCSNHIRLHGLNDTAVTNRLFMDWMILQSQTHCSWTELQHCSHKQTFHELNDTAVTNRLFMDWIMTLQSQTVHGLNDTAVTDRLFMDWIMTPWSQAEFMDWMTLQSQTDCLWTEWHCSHRVHGLNDTAVTNRLFLDWIMTLQSQTDCSWTEWHCCHKQTVQGLNYDTAVTDCSWNEWHCSHKQIVHGMNDTAVTNRLFMDWMTLLSQTCCSGTEWWHCSHRLFMYWPMQQPHQTSWTEWRFPSTFFQ